MKFPGLISTSLVSLFAALGGCGGSNGGSTSQSAATDARPAATQPPDGVPAGTSPLPMPEYGTAYNNPQPRENIQDGGTLTLPINYLGPNYNRLHVDGNTVDVSSIMNWIAPRIWDYSPSGAAAPNENYVLSVDVIGEDPQVVKFVLNPAAKWNDGTPIDWTAFDAVWKTQRGDERYSPGSAVGYESIASVARGENDQEVIVTFETPFYPIETLFMDLQHPKNLDPEFYNSGWINEIHNDLLAGPFVVASLSEERVVLERNPRWWGEPAKLERVTYRQMELNAGINAFQNGEVDQANVAMADRLRQVSSMDNVQIRRGFDTRTVVYILGQASDLFKDEAARKAFMLGTDRRLLATIDFQGLDWEEEPPGSSVMFPWQEGYRDNIADLHFDPEQAKRLLDESGWTVAADDGYRYNDGKRAEITYVTFGDDPTVAALARAQQQMAEDIGIQMHIDIRRSADFGPTFAKGRRDFDVVILAWTATDPFGYSNSCQLYCSDSESNFTSLGTPEIDALFRKVSTISDRDEAIRLANEAESMALHLYGMLPLMNGPKMLAVKKGLVRIGPAGFSFPRAEDIGWQKEPVGVSGGSGTGAR